MAKEQGKSGGKEKVRARKLGVKKQPIRDLGPAEGGRRVKGGAKVRAFEFGPPPRRTGG